MYKLYIGISAQIIPFTNSIRKKILVKNFLITSGEKIVWGILSIVVGSETPDSWSYVFQIEKNRIILNFEHCRYW